VGSVTGQGMLNKRKRPRGWSAPWPGVTISC